MLTSFSFLVISVTDFQLSQTNLKNHEFSHRPVTS